MRKYAVKIGEIQIEAERPITDEMRKTAVDALMREYGLKLLIPEDGVFVVVRVPGEN